MSNQFKRFRTGRINDNITIQKHLPLAAGQYPILADVFLPKNKK